MSPARHHHALPEGYRLHWYEIDSILGQGGFGITYLARDSNLEQLVAIKEFLPSDLAVRTQDSTVQPLSAGHTDTYGWGLNRFLTEARTLAKFRHPNIVRVMSVFEANNTAYMVMEYERGESFENLLKFKQVGGEQTLKNILLPLLDGLELVHDAGFIHRDIKPSNVYLREDGVPVLLDFGSARLALGVETRTLTSLVSPGYAPFEQYNATRESDKQGPWTDIYALGATMYRAVTGKGPVDAAARANLLLDEGRDPFQPCAQMALEDYSQAFLQAIDRALAFPPGDRPQSVDAWRQLVVAGAVDWEAETVAVSMNAASIKQVDFALEDGSATTAPVAATDTATRTVPMTELEAASETPPTANASGRGWFIATSIVAVAGIAVAAWLSLRPATRDAAAPTEIAAATPAPSPTLPEVKPVDESRAQPPAKNSSRDVTQGPAASGTLAAPAPATNAIPAENKPSAPDATATAAAVGASTPATKAPAPAPTPKKSPEKVATVVPTPAPTPKKKAPEKVAKVAPAPAPTPKKKTPEKVAKVAPAPAKKPPEAPSASKKTTSKKSARPRTREEKVAALLVTGGKNLRAGRLTKPKKRNALSDYLTVLAIDKHNIAARRGVEHIVERYVAKAREATGSRQLEKANGYLRQARFVLDAMKLRKWPQAILNPLFDEYREADKLLTAAR